MYFTQAHNHLSKGPLNMKKIFVLLSVGLAITLSVSFLFVINAKAVPAAQTSSSVLYVAPDGNCGGVSPCYETLQDAVNAASAGDEVRVAAGVYIGINEQGGKPQSVYLDKDLTIRGGYTTSNWVTPDPETNLTEINAVALGRAMMIVGDIDVNIDGVRFLNGNATGLMGYGRYVETDSGGGIYINGANVELHRVGVISNTVSDGMGGGIYQYDGELTITDSLIQGNYAGIGAGVHAYSSTLSIRDNRIEGNRTSDGAGSGVYIQYSKDVEVTGNTIANNESRYGSSTIMSIYGGEIQMTIRGNTVSGNSSGGIYMADNYNTVIDSNLVTQNTGQGGIYVYGYDVQVTANTVFSNSTDYAAAITVYAPAQVTGNTVENNTSTNGSEGGGIHFYCGWYGETPESILSDNIIQGNTSSYGNGGGLYFSYCNDLRMMDNLITGNRAMNPYDYEYYGSGGGIYMNQSDIIMENNIVANNYAETKGSGIYAAGSSPMIYHTTIDNNTGGDGAAITAANYYNDPSVIQLHNSIITNHAVGVVADPENQLNTVTINGVLWDGNTENTSGNITILSEVSGAPDFVDPANLDYHLNDTSAAIDQGVGLPLSIDIDGEVRFSPPDLGVDEFWGPGELHLFFMPVMWIPIE